MKSIIKLFRNSKRDVVDVEVQSFKTDSPSLIVHREAFFYMNAEELTQTKRWVITHLPSGQGIIDKIRSRKSALIAANKMAVLDGWENLTPDTAMEFYNLHKDYLLQIKGEAWS